MSVLWLMTGLLLLRFCAPGFSIVGGNVSVPHSRPYMVYIRDPVSERVCGGFLIKEDFVMTAAHCGRHLVVYLGVNDTKLLPDSVAVHPIPHPEFYRNTPGYDIMLLKLKTPATLNETVNTITLPKTENGEILKDCMVMGWGLEEYGHGSPSRVLKEANVTLIDSKNCVTNDTLCSEGTTGTAEGDSGGALVCGDVAQGIVSYYNESNGEYRTRYTHISKYLLWIHHILLGILNCWA
ncbi:chymase-like [Megalobrama amblycephala]|uniref:chymase-like n=1 Tax=Megalobrama amblycephala TaxID=75352 RepID=UPI002014311D|nr:chymase-like [Megalobrama amblycephala]XP_048015387.1 chymase-like [Megalobrama amblycephala]